jgi:hypothetical protein
MLDWLLIVGEEPLEQVLQLSVVHGNAQCPLRARGPEPGHLPNGRGVDVTWVGGLPPTDTTLFLAPLFGGRRITNAIRWLLVVNGIGTIGLIVLTGIMSFGSAGGQTLYRATTAVWAAILTTALLLVATAFQRRLLPGFDATKAQAQ